MSQTYLTLVKSVWETVPKSLSLAPPVYQDLSTRHDWPVKKEFVDLPTGLKVAWISDDYFKSFYSLRKVWKWLEVICLKLRLRWKEIQNALPVIHKVHRSPEQGSWPCFVAVTGFEYYVYYRPVIPVPSRHREVLRERTSAKQAQMKLSNNWTRQKLNYWIQAFHVLYSSTIMGPKVAQNRTIRRLKA